MAVSHFSAECKTENIFRTAFQLTTTWMHSDTPSLMSLGVSGLEISDALCRDCSDSSFCLSSSPHVVPPQSQPSFGSLCCHSASPVGLPVMDTCDAQEMECLGRGSKTTNCLVVSCRLIVFSLSVVICRRCEGSFNASCWFHFNVSFDSICSRISIRHVVGFLPHLFLNAPS